MPVDPNHDDSITPLHGDASKPYGCYNRAPYKMTVQGKDGSWPFRMRQDCSYTTTELGQADPRCSDCRYRLPAPN